ncbi:MAG TPA: protein TolQ [Steroidobacter sp.]|jgi:biopolymer transport protein TolQ|nr:protein TolQ [Steroidobacteraceae bacterium]HLS82353.1 protein TolQ [Steroidobacter sp.]
MTSNLNPLDLVLQASLIVQMVMALLLLASIVSWSIMLRKRAELRQARAEADRFEEAFWSGGDLSAMFRAIDQSRRLTKGMESIFEQGFREFSRLRQQGGVAAAHLIEGSRRGMRVALLKESDRLENSLSMLATIGSTSPYVGLFGTVWGIMNAFLGLGNVQQATLAMVAPGIAEALIATAMGLFAAIPAVIAYNRYADQVSRMELRYDTFVEELTSILQRHASTPRSAPGASVEAHA